MTGTQEDIRERAEELAENADYKIKTNYLYNKITSAGIILRRVWWGDKDVRYLQKPLISYLFEDEQPHVVGRIEGGVLSIRSLEDNREEVLHLTDVNEDATDKSRISLLMVSDIRVLLVRNHRNLEEDSVISIPLNNIEKFSTDTSGGFFIDELTIETGDFLYEFEGVKHYLGMSEETISKYKEIDKNMPELHEEQYIAGRSRFICTKCKEDIDRDATRCPHCGFAPKEKEKGALWDTTGGLLGWTPIGMAMLAKSASDKSKAMEPVTESVEERNPRQFNDGGESSEEEHTPDKNDALHKIEKLNELREKGAITEEEYEDKKSSLLEEI